MLTGRRDSKRMKTVMPPDIVIGSIQASEVWSYVFLFRTPECDSYNCDYLIWQALPEITYFFIVESNPVESYQLPHLWK